MNAMERELEDTIKANLRDDATPHKPPLFVATRQTPTDVEPVKGTLAAFRNQMAKMYEQQRQAVLALQADYDSERARLANTWRRRVDDLMQEAATAIRDCDAKHGKMIREATEMRDDLKLRF